METIKKIFGYLSNLKRYYVIIGITSVVGALISLATPVIMKLATDWIISIINGEQQFDIAPLFYLIGGFLSLTLLTVIATDVGGWYGDMMSVITRRQLSTIYFKHLLSLPQNYYDDELSGKIINRLSRAVTNISEFLQFFANNLLQLILTIIIAIVVLTVYSWPLALLFALLIPMNLFLTAKTSTKWQRYQAKINQHFDIASGRFAEVVSEMRLVKSFRSEKSELTKFDGQVFEMIGLTAKQSRHWHIMNAYRNIAFGSVFGLIYAILFYKTAKGEIGVGDMVLLLTLVQQVAFPMRNLSFFVDRYQRAIANSRDFVAAMSVQPEKETATKKLKVKDGSIEYKNVTFGYQDDEPVLQEVSFKLSAGKKLALVGESGGGKTTISNLLMRLYDPTAGHIYIDGTDISSVSRASLRSQIATVFQDASLFSGSIRENIVYAQPDATDEQVETAARSANAYEFITSLPKGFDTEIGERGVKLSGGQKQRIAIARAILKNAPILILDEATSSLDSKAEKEVQKALDVLMKGRTTMIIAHRLSTIANVNMVVTIKGGRVDEVGSPSKLAKTNGIYAQLLRLQLKPSQSIKRQLEKYDIAS